MFLLTASTAWKMMSSEMRIIRSFPSRKRCTSWHQLLTCFMSTVWTNGMMMMMESSSSHGRRLLNEHANLALIGVELAYKKSAVLLLCIRRRWRGPILHSRVDRSLVYFIHFTWRDACLSWLAASLRFTQHYTRQTMRQFCSPLTSSGKPAPGHCYCIRLS